MGFAGLFSLLLRSSFAIPSLFLRFKAGTPTSDSAKPMLKKPTSLPHGERDTETKPVQTFCEDGASVMQAWSEDGTALVRGWCGEGVSFPEIRLQKM